MENSAEKRSSSPAMKQAWISGRWFPVAILSLLMIISLADRQAISILIGPLEKYFAIGDFEVSLLVGTAFAAFHTFFLLPIGWLSDRYSRKAIIFCCVIFWSLATVASGFAGSLALLFLFRALVGIGEAGLIPNAHAIVGATFPRDRMSAPMTVFSAAISVGIGSGVLVAGLVYSAAEKGAFLHIPLVNTLEPWRLVFICIGLPGLLAAFLVLLLPTTAAAHAPITAGRITEPGFLEYLRQHLRLFVCLMLGMGIASMTMGNMVIWAPEYLRRSFGSSTLMAGMSIGLLGPAASICGMLVMGTMADRSTGRGHRDGPLRVFRWALLLTVPLSIVAYSSHYPAIFLVVLFAMLVLLLPTSGLLSATVQMVIPSRVRSSFAALNILVVSLIGYGIGPSFAGFLSQYVFGREHLGAALMTTSITGASATLLLVLAACKPMRDAVAERESEG